jgi:hypothetical protein
MKSNMKFGALVGMTLILMAGLAGAVFCVSYASLFELALQSGISPGVAWIWPLSLDGLMVLSSLVRIRYSMEGKTHKMGTYVLGAATLASIVLNVAHAPGNPISQIVFGIPPMVLFLSAEMTMGMIQDIVKTRSRATAAKKRAARKKAASA